MPKKCESCRFYAHQVSELYFDLCKQQTVVDLVFPPEFETDKFVDAPLTLARDICNKEGDGIFVYFDPKTPTAGAAFAGNADALVRNEGNARTAAVGGVR